MSIHKIWLGIFGVWFLFLTGLLDFWIQSPGFKQWYKVESSLSERRQEIGAVEARSASLHDVIKQLDVNPIAQEREIRRVLGYLGEKEVVFEFSH